MARTATYNTTVTWKGEHWGHIKMGNGPEMDFSAPPDPQGQGHPGVLTPEDAFVAAVNTCIHMMFIWACERFQIDLVSYECEAEGFKQIHLDQTEEFVRVILRPRIVVRAGDERRVQRALQSARKYSLIAESVRCPVVIEPTIAIIE
jgi:organic hydroperoxide reductase OsmC/OhrA